MNEIAKNNEAGRTGGGSNPLNKIVIPFHLFLAHDRERLDEPFTDGEHTYYSDGNICLRMPLDVAIVKSIPFDINGLPWPKGLMPPLVKFKRPQIQKEKCHYCHGSGEVCVCPDCAGDGYVQWAVGSHDYEADCQECEGSGFVNSGDGEQCDNCAGSGYVDKIEPIHFDGDVALSNIVLNKLAHLPNCVVTAKRVDEHAFYFTFDGGDGIAMGMVV
jgi:hypothetical protein